MGLFCILWLVFNNLILICWGYVAKGTTYLPIAYNTFYSIAFAQSDRADSAHVGRAIWLTSNKQLSCFGSEADTTTLYITIGY